MTLSTTAENQPHLKRVLGRFDLVLLFVVAVFNLNVVPSIAANGGVTVWLWVFFVIFLLLYMVFKSAAEAAVLIFPTFYAMSGCWDITSVSPCG